MYRIVYLLPSLAFLAAAPARAGDDDYIVVKTKLKVEAGKHNRDHEPVSVPLSLPPHRLADVQLLLAGKPFVPAQLSPPTLVTEHIKAAEGKQRRDLEFVLPKLAAGKSLDLEAVITVHKAPAGGADGYIWFSHGGRAVELQHAERPILRYEFPRYDDKTPKARFLSYKPFHHVYAPGGRGVITNGPTGRYPHHRGLFFGFMKCGYDGNQVDTWHCKGDAHQAHDGFLTLSTGRVLGRHRVAVNWNGVGKKTFAKEEREVAAYNVPGGTLIEFSSRLSAVDGKVKLDGDPQHAGFHFRANSAVEGKTEKQTIFVRPDGADKPGATRNWPKDKRQVNLPWDVMSFVLGDRRFSVAYLDRPSNPKEARYSEREYGRIGSYFVYEVTKDKPLLINYRVWVQDGLMTVDQAAAKSRAFLEPVKVTVR
jgi:hypothetical protein